MRGYLLGGTAIVRAPDGEAGGGAAPGGDKGGGAAPGAAVGNPFLTSLPEPLRAHAAFKDVKDLGDLGTRYVAAMTPKPLAEILPQEIAGEAYFKDIKTVPDLAKKAFHQAKLIGKDPNSLIEVPGANATAEQLAPIYDRLGRPAKAELGEGGYQIPAPQGREWTAEERALQTAMLPAAHKAGLNTQQLQVMNEALGAYGTQVATAKKAEQDRLAGETATALKTKWGGAYEQRMDRTNQAITYLAQKAGIDAGQLNAELDRTKIGNAPVLAQVLDIVGGMLEEDGVLGRAKSGDETQASPNEARQQLTALMTDKDFVAAWTSKTHPKHGEAVARRSALFDQAYPAAG